MTSSLPPVSIGLPFYNAERFLLDSIKSVFAQTHQDWELILMNDGSTDRSLEIARSIDDPRVRVYSDGKNKKLAARLNEINALAQYDFIARMDADDLMTPDRIARLLEHLQGKPEYDLVSCGTYSVNGSLQLIGQRGQSVEHYTAEGLLNKSQRFLHAGLVARKSWYERNRYNEDLVVSQDGELWHRAVRKGDFRALSIPDPLYMYREDRNVTAKKLLMAYKMERIHVLKFIDQRSKRVRRRLESWAKSGAVIALDTFGNLDYLLARRQEQLPNKDSIAAYEAAKSIVLDTQVPLRAPRD